MVNRDTYIDFVKHIYIPHQCQESIYQSFDVILVKEKVKEIGFENRRFNPLDMILVKEIVRKFVLTMFQ